MAALVTGPGFDVTTLAGKLAGNLPAYARPLFLRLQPEIDITGTFKQKKADLVAEGFDPATIDDPLYILQDGRYVPLDAARHADILAGRAKL
jgi:fatty-acyl-CoA synthase